MGDEERALINNLDIDLSAVCKVAILNLLGKVKEIERDENNEVVNDGGLYEFMKQLDFGIALEIGMGVLAEEYENGKVADEVNRRAMAAMKELSQRQARIDRKPVEPQ